MVPDWLCLLYLLYWYNSTSTDAARRITEMDCVIAPDWLTLPNQVIHTN
jgi:hypothetical protein